MVLTVEFVLDGQEFTAINGGPDFTFDEAISMLITCAYLRDESTPWVLQSLFLAAIGEARERGAKAVEAFAYRYPEGESAYERFRVHKTVFPAFTTEQALKVAASAYNCGIDRALEGSRDHGDSDYHTTPPPYGADVIRRMRAIEEIGL